MNDSEALRAAYQEALADADSEAFNDAYQDALLNAVVDVRRTGKTTLKLAGGVEVTVDYTVAPDEVRLVDHPSTGLARTLAVLRLPPEQAACRQRADDEIVPEEEAS